LEDEIESQRQKKVEELKKSGKGTPVTPETFAAWQERKRKRRQEEAKKKVEAELKKKKGGKGLAVLSGRDLYDFKADLFNIGDDYEGQGDNENKNDEKKNDPTDADVKEVAEKVETNLFLEGDDDDLDDLDDD
jgi:hypothetical protein